jgi:RNA polymerase sigma-70 factor, ECF subfamily
LKQEKHSGTKDEDSLLVNGVLSGQTDEYETLIKRHENRIFRLIGSHVPWRMVDELAHDTFVRAWQGLSSLEKPDRYGSWLSSIAVRVCYDYWRNNKRNHKFTELSVNSEKFPEDSEPFPLLEQACIRHREHAHRDDIRQTVENMLTKLKEDEQRLVRMVYLEGHSLQEAGAEMGVSAGNARVQIHRIKNKLKASIENTEEI